MIHNVLLESDFIAIERVTCPVDQILPYPYDTAFDTARLRVSMFGYPLKPIAAQLLGIRYAHLMIAPETTAN